MKNRYWDGSELDAYLVDGVTVIYSVFVDYSVKSKKELSEAIIKTGNMRGEIRNGLPEGKTRHVLKVFIRKKFRAAYVKFQPNGGIRITFYCHLNSNRLLRYHFKRKFNISRFSTIPFEHNSNCIPLQLWEKLKKRGYEIERIRKIGRRLMWDEITLAEKALLLSIYNVLRVRVPDNWVKKSFGKFEVSNDLIGPPSWEMPEDKAIKEKFLKTPLLEWRSESGAANKRPFLTGEHSDGAEEKLYYKSSGPLGSQNRAERAYSSSEKISAAFKTNTFKTRKDLLILEKAAGDRAVEFWKRLYQKVDLNFEKKKWKILKDCIRASFGVHWFEAWKSLKKKGCIHTGGAYASTHRPVAKIARKLNGGILVRVKGGIYVPNWPFILAFNKRFIGQK